MCVISGLCTQPKTISLFIETSFILCKNQLHFLFWKSHTDSKCHLANLLESFKLFRMALLRPKTSLRILSDSLEAVDCGICAALPPKRMLDPVAQAWSRVSLPSLSCACRSKANSPFRVIWARCWLAAFLASTSRFRPKLSKISCKICKNQ